MLDVWTYIEQISLNVIIEVELHVKKKKNVFKDAVLFNMSHSKEKSLDPDGTVSA